MEKNVFLSQVNHARFNGQTGGHYESYFQRANHPTRPLAFWIRYTLFSPKNKLEKSLGELWAIFFNGETNKHVAVKQEFALSDCVFSSSSFHVQIGDALLNSEQLNGNIQYKKNTFSWDLSITNDGTKPLLLFPIGLYKTKLPAAKSLVGMPKAHYKGKLKLNGETVDIKNWLGSQNHNWGKRHTDLYAWGQVAGFDTYQNSFLELATAKLKIGPFWTPAMTLIILRHKGKEYKLNGIIQSIKAHGVFNYFVWNFISKTKEIEIEGTISAPRNAFVGLNYYNPPGGSKHCLNTKIAKCTIKIIDKNLGTEEILETNNRAAFEILTNDKKHGIDISA